MAEPRLLDQVREAIRVRHYSLRTEETYVQWIRRYILFHHKRHPREMGEGEIGAFLSFLAVEKHVSASTQNQALAAILFLYKEVLKQELEWVDNVVRAKRSTRIPEVLSPGEVQRLLSRLGGVNQLIAQMLYGTGMRLMEGLRLRVQDVDFHYRQITVRNGKGGKDRVTARVARMKRERNPGVHSETAARSAAVRRRKTCGLHAIPQRFPATRCRAAIHIPGFRFTPSRLRLLPPS